MAYILLDYFQKQGKKVIEDSLRGVAGKPVTSVLTDAHYRQLVIRRGWDTLPVAIRLLMNRQYALWDDFYLALRNEVFDLTGAAVVLRPNLSVRVAELLWRFFKTADEAPPSNPLLMRRSCPANGPVTAEGVPLAQPVAPTAPPPLARPVAPSARTNGVGSPSPTPQATSATATVDEPAAKARGLDIPVGIDLGTTYSVIAYVDAQGRPTTIPNAAGDRLTPSVVLFEEEGTLVGKEAVLASAMQPLKVAECVKRDMGAKVYRKPINGEYLPPEVISSLILRSLKTDAERVLGPIQRAVITVPAYFEETRRRATVDAGRLAGLVVLDIINEPTAAAIAYGYQLGFLDRSGKVAGESPLRVLVYDLGGGTFDVTIVEIREKAFKALATDGDVSLGGKDWDEKLINLTAERFRQQHREDPRDNPISLQELKQSAEMAKRTLTELRKAAIYVNHLGSRLKFEVTRQEFEEATAPLLERTRLTTELVVRQAGLTWADIDRILLVGGATRMPMVVRMLEELTGRPIDRSISVDEAVAQGAALYAELLAPKKAAGAVPANFTVTNVNSHSLGILGADPRTGKKRNKILIPKNTPLPRTVTKSFKTFKPNQQSVVIKVLEGDSDDPTACSQVGVCAIHNLPSDLPIGWPVRVSYTYETNGRLHVTARLKGHKVGVTTDFLRENSLPDDDLELWAHFVAEEMSKRS